MSIKTNDHKENEKQKTRCFEDSRARRKKI